MVKKGYILVLLEIIQREQRLAEEHIFISQGREASVAINWREA
jgi:hypothetical protein